MKKGWNEKRDSNRTDMSRRDFCRVVAGISLFSASSAIELFASEEDIPLEPENLDEPTPWQEGDPDPVEMKIPALEPEQTSSEAPPSQPMDDERPDQPSVDHIWVTGYWWWTNKTYKWVPGYWVVPPHKNYTYVSGYWAYEGTKWVYHRGGWAKPNTSSIVVYPRPRPILTARVITAPRRIVRRHRRWRHHPARRVSRRVVRRQNRRVNRRRNR